MFWTKRVPTEPGYYWWRKDISRHASVVHVRGEWLSTIGSGSYRVAEAGGQWCGPLQSPGGDAVENCRQQEADQC